MKKRQELIGPIQDAIYNAIKEIATQKSYDAVIDRASAQSMIFASPRIDISNEVLARLGYSNNFILLQSLIQTAHKIKNKN